MVHLTQKSWNLLLHIFNFTRLKKKKTKKQYSGQTHRTINQIFTQMSLLKNFNMQFHHTNCKTLHYLLDKTKIQNKFHHIFFQKVSGK